MVGDWRCFWWLKKAAKKTNEVTKDTAKGFWKFVAPVEKTCNAVLKAVDTIV